MSTIAEIEVIGVVGSVRADKSKEGDDYVTLSVAHRKNKKDAQGKWSSDTEWFSVFSSNPKHIEMCRNIAKGDLVRVVGEFKIRHYENNGKTQIETTIYARSIKVTQRKKKEKEENNDGCS